MSLKKIKTTYDQSNGAYYVYIIEIVYHDGRREIDPCCFPTQLQAMLAVRTLMDMGSSFVQDTNGWHAPLRKGDGEIWVKSLIFQDLAK